MSVEMRPCPSFPGYSVSDEGAVFSFRNFRKIRLLPTPRRKKPHLDGDGYERVGVMIDGRQRTAGVHALVLDAFVGLRPFPGAVARHLDGNRRNNRPDNLAWGTVRENTDDRISHGRLLVGDTHPRAILNSEQVAFIREARRLGRKSSLKLRELAAMFGVTATTICKAAKGHSWIAR